MNLEWIYYTTCGLGFFYILGAAALGQLDDGGGIGEAGDLEIESDGPGTGDDGALDGQDESAPKRTARIIGPSCIAAFCFFFGAFGAACLRIFPAMGYFSVPIALVAAYFCTTGVFRLLGMMLRKLTTETITYREAAVVGVTAELTIPISPGRTGEITFALQGGRNSGPARCKDPEREIKKLSHVVVVDIQDGVFIVEPCADEASL